MRPSGTNIFQHFHASFFFHSVRSHATVSNMQMSEWMSEWMSVRMSIWMSVWMYEWQISKFTQQFQSQTLYLSSCERIWSHQATKLLSLHFSQAKKRERWKRDATKRRRRGVLLHCIRNSLSIGFRLRKMENWIWLANARFFIAKNENRWKLWDNKKNAVDTRSILE